MGSGSITWTVCAGFEEGKLSAISRQPSEPGGVSPRTLRALSSTSPMDKDQIICEIRRTAEANGGVSLGWERFKTETGVRKSDWFGKIWSCWSDAIAEAGLEPNKLKVPWDDAYLLRSLCELTQQLGHVPVEGELLLAKKSDPTFPTPNAFYRLGDKVKRASRIVEFCDSTAGFEEVAELWRQIVVLKQAPSDDEPDRAKPQSGYVYLLKHGSRREYKIGRTNNAIRREGELRIALPEQVQPVHYIETDDPPGIEAGWPRRCFERLGDEGTRGIAEVNWSFVSSCCSSTQTSKAMSGPPRGRDS